MRSVPLLFLLFLWAAPVGAAPTVLATWDGQHAGEQFGIALALGGDANGDGLADLAVGASTNDEQGQNAGKVSIYFGRVTPLSAPDLVLYGSPGSFFGGAVAWVGDVNGDGYDDLLVGAFHDSQGGADAGKAYLFLGGSPMDTVPDLVLVGAVAGGWFGHAVSAAGDINGDHLADFMIGAPMAGNGSVSVYFGHNPPDGTPHLVLNGASPGDRFGYSLAGPGNVDGIPGDDILVGAPKVTVAHTWQGAAYLYSGGTGFGAVPELTILGGAAGDQLGFSVAGAGDVNGDGSPDFLVGAPYHNKRQIIDAGAAYVYYGGALLDANADFVIEGSAQDDNLGESVAGCGDVTGSGYSAFVAGAPLTDVGGSDAGTVVLSPGGNPPRTTDLIYYRGEAAGDELGYAVAGGAGISGLSFAGDNKPDFAAGAWAHGVGGKAYLYGIAADPTGVASPLSPAGGIAGARARLAVIPNPGRTFSIEMPWAGAPSKGARSLSGDNGAAVVPPNIPLVLRILDASGALVRSLSLPLGPNQRVEWDGRDLSGVPVASGTYLLALEGAGKVWATGKLGVLR